jgi:hypothetical protein
MTSQQQTAEKTVHGNEKNLDISLDKVTATSKQDSIAEVQDVESILIPDLSATEKKTDRNASSVLQQQTKEYLSGWRLYILVFGYICLTLYAYCPS